MRVEPYLQGFLPGVAAAALVAWLMWPSQREAVAEPDEPQRAMRALDELRISATETMRRVIVPAPDTVSAFTCIIYRDHEAGIAQLACPNAESLDLGDVGEP